MRGRSHTVPVGEKKLEWEDEQEVDCVNLLREAKPVVIWSVFVCPWKRLGYLLFNQISIINGLCQMKRESVGVIKF